MRDTTRIWVLAAALLVAIVRPVTAQVRVPDLDGRLVDPFAPSTGVKATALVFISTECPISNRYAPELQRIAREFGAKGVRFWLVYGNPAESAAAIRTHGKAYGYAIAALRDPDHRLVRLAKATVTPEAAVFDDRGRLAYRGRIDNRYVTISVTRPAATEHDLVDALRAVLAGTPVAQPVTQAIGCFLADFQP